MKMIRSLTAAIAFAILICTPVSAAAQTEHISSCMDEFKKITKCKDVSIAVYSDGETSFYGDNNKLYQIGSMTKAFTGLAVTKLAAEGKISEDTFVDEVLTGFSAYYGSRPAKITIGQLLRQTSGFTSDETMYPSGTYDMSLSDWVMSISGKELASAPGEKYAYSNANYNLLGAVIETVSHMPYKDYMEEMILEPLELSHTYAGFPDDAGQVVEGSRLGYRSAFDYPLEVAASRIPAGYFYSDAEDMGRWMRIWIGKETVPEEYVKLIGYVKSSLFKEGDYFSGWEMFEDGAIGHSGGTPNYSSRMIFGEKEDAGVCVLTNINAASSTDSLCNGIFATVTGRSDDKVRISYDVWTVFDIIFTIITFIGLFLIMVCLRLRRYSAIIATGLGILVIFLALIIVLPGIFGAGLDQILMTWAPYSLAGGMLILLIDIILFAIKAIKVKRECG